MSYIEEYYEWIKKNPNKVCNKIKKQYEKLVEDLKTPKKVSFYNKLTDSIEEHTYIFDEKKIDFLRFVCGVCSASSSDTFVSLSTNITVFKFGNGFS